MRTRSDVIVCALDMRAKGMSLGKIVDHLKTMYNYNVSRQTILDWQNKFGERIESFTKHFTLESSYSSHADEVFLRVKGSHVDEFIYYWDCIDYDTKFLVADHISNARTDEHAEIFLKNIRSRLRKQPIQIHTDNSHDYFPTVKKILPYSVHMHFPAWRKKFKNNPIERFHNTLKENYKVIRKYHSISSAYKHLVFIRNYYNFLRPHQSLGGLTPAQKAGFGGWTWWSIIKKLLCLQFQLMIN